MGRKREWKNEGQWKTEGCSMRGRGGGGGGGGQGGGEEVDGRGKWRYILRSENINK